MTAVNSANNRYSQFLLLVAIMLYKVIINTELVNPELLLIVEI